MDAIDPSQFADTPTGLIVGQLDDAIRKAVTGLRAAGYSWAEIAARLRVTRQAAPQRWGHPQ